MRGRIVKIGACVVFVAALAGGGAAWATGTVGDSEQPLTGSSLDKATSAALAETGGGRVTEAESGDDGAAYTVEVRLSDGTQVEVDLDSDFNVIGREGDDDAKDDSQDDSQDD